MAAVRVSCRPSGLNLASCSSLCCCLWMLVSIHVAGVGSLSFNISFSQPQRPANLRELLNCTGDATIDTEGLHLTRDRGGQSAKWSAGQAQYMEAVPLWDRASGKMASFTTRAVMGTAGYIDPEFVNTHHPSTYSDVYSFGVVLLEIVSSRCPVIMLESGAHFKCDPLFNLGCAIWKESSLNTVVIYSSVTGIQYSFWLSGKPPVLRT